MNTHAEHFASTHGRARRLFRAACERAGARVFSYINPNGESPEGEKLACDIAWVGSVAAKKVVLVISGVHGLEAPAGSAAQIAWLRSNAPRSLEADVAVVLVHSLNPWGHAWRSRLNENAVDLNRNFLPDWSDPPTNPHFPLFSNLELKRLDAVGFAAIHETVEAIRGTHGDTAVRIGLWGGQYERPKGLSFGGLEPQWSNLILRRASEELLRHARIVALIDWHTGYRYLELPFLFIYGHGETLARRAIEWWGGEQRVYGWTGAEGQRELLTAGNGSLRYASGQLRNALPEMLPWAHVTGATIEFGTQRTPPACPLPFIEQWLTIHGLRKSPQVESLLAANLHASCPDDSLWRSFVIEHGIELTNQAVAGVSRW